MPMLYNLTAIRRFMCQFHTSDTINVAINKDSIAMTFMT